MWLSMVVNSILTKFNLDTSIGCKTIIFTVLRTDCKFVAGYI